MNDDQNLCMSEETNGFLKKRGLDLNRIQASLDQYDRLAADLPKVPYKRTFQITGVF